MSPLQGLGVLQRADNVSGSAPPSDRAGIVLEGWSEGFRFVQGLIQTDDWQ